MLHHSWYTLLGRGWGTPFDSMAPYQLLSLLLIASTVEGHEGLRWGLWPGLCRPRIQRLDQCASTFRVWCSVRLPPESGETDDGVSEQLRGEGQHLLSRLLRDGGRGGERRRFVKDALIGHLPSSLKDLGAGPKVSACVGCVWMWTGGLDWWVGTSRGRAPADVCACMHVHVHACACACMGGLRMDLDWRVGTSRGRAPADVCACMHVHVHACACACMGGLRMDLDWRVGTSSEHLRSSAKQAPRPARHELISSTSPGSRIVVIVRPRLRPCLCLRVLWSISSRSASKNWRTVAPAHCAMFSS